MIAILRLDFYSSFKIIALQSVIIEHVINIGHQFFLIRGQE